MNKKYRVKLSQEDWIRIQAVQSSQSTTKTVRNRCQVLLLLNESICPAIKHTEISKRTGVSGTAIRETARNYCTQGIEYTLRPRVHEKPPVTPKVTGEKEARIITLACSTPPEGYARWSLRLLTKSVIELGIVDSIGVETVRRTLKNKT